MKAIFKTTVYAAIAAGLLSSCINDDDYSIPTLECIDTPLVANMQPQAVPATATAAQYTGDGIIEAYVTSSDLGGNFYKSISFQTLDGQYGFSVPVDNASYGGTFDVGRKVLIKLDGTYTDIAHSSKRIGALYQGQVGRMTLEQAATVLNRSCTVVSEEDLVKKISISEALNNNYINTLIELQDVEFTVDAVNNTYFDDSNVLGGSTNWLLEDETGATIIFRTSEFASYAGSTVPAESGTVRGVLTKFNNDYQFVARYESDIKLDQPRFGDAPPEPGEPGESDSALGGTEITYSGSFTEDFESYAVNANTFPKYVNDYTEGDRYWQIKQYQNNKYIEMTAFNGANNPGEAGNTFFVVPVDFGAASTFSFDKEIRYNNGVCLRVYYAEANDYTPLNEINTGNFTDITSEFTALTYPASGQSQNSFTTAGTYNIPATLSGNGYFVFEYYSNGSVTTTIQIDNISIQ
ncbi:DUF5689 domain-containing protein [Flavobacterium akiainvivens]|uniref:DUF5689 domain-containing protein n=1 Tax=Flavobacterium akiainvivens TaxID=1202724 RepID=UPI0006C8C91D|nr:DUF5689 domain-containing protein [Flavobacterium akiainvivens]SFQ69724.1 hypothetical protein SAMN05444144_11565 [Flavobacterium akiainvivens]